MVEQNVRNLTLSTELTRFHTSPENDDILLIDETLIDQWTTSPDKRFKITPVRVLPVQDRQSNLSISPGATPPSACQPLSKQQGATPLSKAIETITAVPVPLKSPSVECADSQKQRPPPCHFNVVSVPMNQSSSSSGSSSMKDGSPLQNGRIWRYSTAFTPSNNQPVGIESTTGQLRRRTIHSIMPIVTSTTGAGITCVPIINVALPVVKKQQTQILSLEKPVVQSKCRQCGNVSGVCECAAKVITCGIVSSTCEPFQTLENLKRKSRLPNQNNSSKSVLPLTKQSFYGKKLSDQFEVLVSPASSCGTGTRKFFMRTAVPTTMSVITAKKKPRLAKMPEPECLTISSDDEEEKSSQQSDSLDIPELPESHKNPTLLELASGSERTFRDKSGKIIKSRGGKKPTVVMLQKDISCKKDEKVETEMQEMEEDDIPASTSETIKFVVNCRSIRVGSYKLHACEDESLPAVFTNKDISFTIPTVLDQTEMVSLTVRFEDIASVLAHFGKALVVLFIYTTPGCGGGIRSRLRMISRTSNYYDPCASDETCKRITILPIGITKEQVSLYRKVFPKRIIQEISQVQANEILVRSVPVGQSPHIDVRIIGKMTRSQTTTAKQIILSPGISAPKPIVKLLTYPPPPQTGGITITSEDLECLNPLEFLNDVIIDFYLKYLVMEKLDESERKRMHVFSSFFYPRLTQKPTVRNCIEENTSITSQQKKHNRVKTWTRHIDIFEKDFIIIPVNQNAHWFLAIICFPGKVAIKKEESKDNTSPEETSQNLANELVENSTTLMSSQGESEEPMDVDPSMKSSKTAENLEADDPESPFPPKRISLVPYDSEDSSDGVGSNMTEEPTNGTSDQDSPSILIFDSLPGPSRWRIVATLREYLEVEWEIKKGTKCSFDRETMKGRNVRVPVQSNFSDCGVYLLQYVESFFENSSKPFTCPNLELWFPEESITQKRDEIKELILSLQKKYNGTNSNNASAGSDDSSNSSTSSSSVSGDLNGSTPNAKEETTSS